MSGRGGGFGGQDGAGECGDVVAAVVAAAVDEEGRGAGDTAEVGGVDVLGDPRGAGALAEVLTESLAVEPEVAGVADQVARLEGVLVLQEQVVHLPERVLVSGGFRGLGGELGVRVDVVQREVAPHVPDVAVAGEHVPAGRARPGRSRGTRSRRTPRW